MLACICNIAKKGTIRATLTINLQNYNVHDTITKISISGAVSKALLLVAFISGSSVSLNFFFVLCIFKSIICRFGRGQSKELTRNASERC